MFSFTEVLIKFSECPRVLKQKIGELYSSTNDIINLYSWPPASNMANEPKQNKQNKQTKP